MFFSYNQLEIGDLIVGTATHQSTKSLGSIDERIGTEYLVARPSAYLIDELDGT
jgi:hypothetical protein